MIVRFRLREIMEEKGMTSQNDVARRAGLTYPTVNAIYHNRAAAINLTTLAKLAKALRVRPGDLITDEPEKR